MGGSMPWPEVTVSNRDFTNTSVLVIGSGMSGMCMGIDLLKRGISNFLIVEKGSGVGGVWRDNKYPGCCCDIWALLYQYSFEQNSDWSRLYPGQEEILEYLISTAAKYGLYKHVRFNAAVEAASWDEPSGKWKTDVRVTGEKDAEYQDRYTVTSDFLVSAVGQLSFPQWPAIDGLADFGGKLMHSSRWDWGYPLEGKRIGVIGNGATGVQLVPELAKVASQLTIFQRTPAWIAPRMDQPMSPAMRRMFRWVPFLRSRTRAGMMDMREWFHGVVKEPGGELSNFMKTTCIQHIEQSLPGDANKELRELLTPDYAPTCKRILASDDFYPALTRANVKLETRSVRKVTSSGIVVIDGKSSADATTTVDLDLLVCATGFKALDYMHPIKMKGLGGVGLDSVWSDGAQALYGIFVDKMPNFAMLYGPNTNLGHSSIILMIEQQSRYIATMVSSVLDARERKGIPISLTPKPQALQAWNEKVQADLRTTAFGHTSCKSWYRDPRSGRVVTNWSGNVVDYQKALSALDWADFEGGELMVQQTGSASGRKQKVGRRREESYISDASLKKLVAGGTAVAALLVGWRMYAGSLRLSR